ncbi:hypothetical protein [Streptomyces sp. NRRL B-24720]|uniref:hypothetical protein n=1 Tax=Streptomyces sp. NRRL B-24720 TaxID=1476876 RepID=UPI0004C6430F|nr:hypothetical protein [Streptomyces sp. NRRL B-24720]
MRKRTLVLAAAVTTRYSSGVPGSSEGGDSFGAELATADFDKKDGYTDLAVDAHGEDIGPNVDQGSGANFRAQPAN